MAADILLIGIFTFFLKKKNFAVKNAYVSKEEIYTIWLFRRESRRRILCRFRVTECDFAVEDDLSLDWEGKLGPVTQSKS